MDSARDSALPTRSTPSGINLRNEYGDNEVEASIVGTRMSSSTSVDIPQRNNETTPTVQHRDTMQHGVTEYDSEFVRLRAMLLEDERDTRNASMPLKE